MNSQELLNQLNNKYIEWLEIAGDQAPALFSHILASIIIKEREYSEYLKKRLEHEATK